MGGAKQEQINCGLSGRGELGPRGGGGTLQGILGTCLPFLKNICPQGAVKVTFQLIALGFLLPKAGYALKNTRKPNTLYLFIWLKNKNKNTLSGLEARTLPGASWTLGHGVGVEELLSLLKLLTSCPVGDQPPCDRAYLS